MSNDRWSFNLWPYLCSWIHLSVASLQSSHHSEPGSCSPKCLYYLQQIVELVLDRLQWHSQRLSVVSSVWEFIASFYPCCSHLLLLTGAPFSFPRGSSGMCQWQGRSLLTLLRRAPFCNSCALAKGQKHRLWAMRQCTELYHWQEMKSSLWLCHEVKQS